MIELWGLFVGSFLASTLLPGGSEALLILLANESNHSAFILLVLATVGNTLGGLTSWGIGWWLALKVPTKFLEDPKNNRALSRIQDHGAPILLLSWVPIVGDPLCVAAGYVGVKWPIAIIYMAIGKCIRYAVILSFI